MILRWTKRGKKTGTEQGALLVIGLDYDNI